MKISRNIFLLFIFCSLSVALLAGDQGKQPKNLVITGARLIDGTGAPPLKNAVIVITNGKFQAVGAKGKVAIPKEAEVIDVKGKTVIPGLFDTHMHFTFPPKPEDFLTINDSISSFRAAESLHRLLMGGITTVRSVLEYRNVGVVAKKAFREGLFIGSRPIVVRQGITSTGGHGAEGMIEKGLVVEADGPAGFRRAVREQIKAGADLIKVLPPYSREEIKAAVEATHEHEMFITVHAGIWAKKDDFVRWAVEAGADCLEHGHGIPDDVIQMMAKKGTYCVPTLTVQAWWVDRFGKRPGMEWQAEKFREAEEIFKKMKKAGIKMAVGTDTCYETWEEDPGRYFEEIERFVKNGYTPMEAIVAATKIGAEVSVASDRLGTIEKGKIADLLVLSGDPLKDIRVLRKDKIIIQEGKVIKR